jgi:hypothetical protein
MHAIFDSPFIIFIVSLVAQSLAALLGDFLRKRSHSIRKDEREDLSTEKAASLTLLALIIGFSFSMAVTRYDQRKNYEEGENNAIGTEYARADLLPTEDAKIVHTLLKQYLNLRIAFYSTVDQQPVSQINADTAKIQAELWSAVSSEANAQPTAIRALVAAGMNDVLNSQSYTEASWLNRIPTAAWIFMLLIAVSCNILVGYSERRTRIHLLFVLPLIVSISFLLIADIESPRGGIIRIHPQNLLALSRSFEGH